MTIPCVITAKNKKGNEQTFVFRRCTPEHLEAISDLQERVIYALTDGSVFMRTTQEKLEESLRLDYCLAAFWGDTPAMVSIMVSSRISPRNLGWYLNYSEECLLRTVTYDTTFVDPAFRGYGLQRLSFRFKDAEAVSLGGKEALATVAPHNDASMHNLIAAGFTAVTRRILYGGRERWIMRKDLGKVGSCHTAHILSSI